MGACWMTSHLQSANMCTFFSLKPIRPLAPWLTEGVDGPAVQCMYCTCTMGRRERLPVGSASPRTWMNVAALANGVRCAVQ